MNSLKLKEVKLIAQGHGTSKSKYHHMPSMKMATGEHFTSLKNRAHFLLSFSLHSFLTLFLLGGGIEKEDLKLLHMSKEAKRKNYIISRFQHNKEYANIISVPGTSLSPG